MAKSTIGGKKPLSSKAKSSGAFGVPDFFKNKFAIPEWALAQLAAEGKEGRYIAYKAYVENGNTHDKGWTIHKFKPESTSASDPGLNADGIIRRGDSVLASRPKEFGDKHRQYLRYRAELQGSSFKKSQANELREMARQADITVHEGYEADGEPSDD